MTSSKRWKLGVGDGTLWFRRRTSPTYPVNHDCIDKLGVNASLGLYWADLIGGRSQGVEPARARKQWSGGCGANSESNGSVTQTGSCADKLSRANLRHLETRQMHSWFYGSHCRNAARTSTHTRQFSPTRQAENSSERGIHTNIKK